MNTQKVANAIKKALEDGEGMTEAQIHEAVFHMTDCLYDFMAYAEFLRKPESYSSEEVRKLLISFLVHVPDHLDSASRIVLQE